MKNLSYFILGPACLLSAIVLSSCESTEPQQEESISIQHAIIDSGISKQLLEMNAEYNNGTGIEGVYQISCEQNSIHHIDFIESFKLNNFGMDFSDFVVENLTMSNSSATQQVSANLVSNAVISPVESKSELPAKIEALHSIGLNSLNSLGIHIRNWEVNAVGIEEISLKNITITFPKYIQFEDGTNVFKATDITLNESNNFYTSINYTIKNINIAEDEQDDFISNENGIKYLSFAGDVHLNASTTIKYNPSKIEKSTVDFDFTHSSFIQEVKNIKGEFDVINSIIDEIVVINNTPSLNSSLWNSSQQNDIFCEFSFNNSSSLALETSLLITPWDTASNSAVGNPVCIDLKDKYCIRPNVTTTFVISSAPQKGSNYASKNIINENLSQIITPTTNAYKVSSSKITTNSLYSNDMVLGQNSLLKGNYKGIVSIPFSDFHLNHTEKIENINQTIKIKGENANKASFKFMAYNTLSTDIEISFDFFDAEGNKLNELEANSIVLKSCTFDDIKYSNISIDSENLADNSQFKLLDKIAFNFKALNEDNKKITLSPYQKIYISPGEASFLP